MDTEPVSELLVGLNHLMCLLAREVVVNEAYCETGQVNFVTWLVDISCVFVVVATHVVTRTHKN
jgi:hypothetical protein